MITADIEGPEISPVLKANQLAPCTNDQDQVGLRYVRNSESATWSGLEEQTALAKSVLTTTLVCGILCDTELHPIILAALQDVGIGIDHFDREVQRLIEFFGRDLQAEARNRIGQIAADAFQGYLKTGILALLIDLRTRGWLRGQPIGNMLSRQFSHLAAIDCDTMDHDETNILTVHEVLAIENLIRSSKAYCTYKKGLLIFAHQPYQKRISISLREAGIVIDDSGKVLDAKGTMVVALEVSWTPTTLFRWSYGGHSSVADRLKGLVEDSMGETWNWWPLHPRVRRLDKRFCRLSWQTVRLLLL